jgi:hypothetical protein
MTKKVLDNFEIWNDLYFKNCYYSALFPMILHFNKSITPIVLNDIYIYQKNDDDKRITIGLRNDEIAKDYTDVLKERGIIEQVITPKDVVEEIKSNIDSNRPVMLFIDCFYETLRFDTINYIHCGHILMIYGYNDNEQAFEILEHKYATGFTYDRFMFSYEDAKKCHDGFLENCSHNDFSGFIVFDGDTEQGKKPYTTEDEKNDIKIFIDVMNTKKADILKGIDDLSDFIANFDEFFEKLKNSPELFGEVCEMLNRIKLSKSVERYRLLKVFGNNEKVMSIADKLLELWAYESSIFSKICGGMKKEYIDAAKERFNMIPALEREYVNVLFEALDEWRVKNI